MTLLTIIPLIIVLSLAIYHVARYWGEIDIKNERQYDMLHSRIEEYIDEWPETESLKLALNHLVDDLEELPHKNPEKSEVLRGRVDYKFRDKSLDEINELKKQYNELVSIADWLYHGHSLQADIYAKANNIKTQINELEKQVI